MNELEQLIALFVKLGIPHDVSTTHGGPFEVPTPNDSEKFPDGLMTAVLSSDGLTAHCFNVDGVYVGTASWETYSWKPRRIPVSSNAAATDAVVWPTKPGDICPRCRLPKGEGRCHGEGGCDELVCEGWGDSCCRCGKDFALGQLP